MYSPSVVGCRFSELGGALIGVRGFGLRSVDGGLL